MKNIITKQLNLKQKQWLKDNDITFECVPVLDFKIEFDSTKTKELLATKGAIWIFTSVRAVEALQGFLKEAESPEKIFTVGRNAVAELEKLGFQVDFSSNVSEDLLPVLEQNIDQPMLYFRGRHFRNSIPDFCKSNQYDFQSLECYHSIKLPLLVSLKNYSSIWVFSPLSAHAVSDWEGVSLDVPIFSIGEVTSSYLKKLGFKKVFHPKVPSFENVVELFLKKSRK